MKKVFTKTKEKRFFFFKFSNFQFFFTKTKKKYKCKKVLIVGGEGCLECFLGEMFIFRAL